MACGPGCLDRWTPPQMKMPYRPPAGGWTISTLPPEIEDEKLHSVWASRKILNHNSGKAAVHELERFLKNNKIKIARNRLREHATNLWRARDPARFPMAQSKADKVEAGLFDMAFSAAKAFVKSGIALVKGEKVIAGKEEATRRLTVCLQCPEFLPDERRCKKCGCFVEYKKLLATESCPLGKW